MRVPIWRALRNCISMPNARSALWIKPTDAAASLSVLRSNTSKVRKLPMGVPHLESTATMRSLDQQHQHLLAPVYKVVVMGGADLEARGGGCRGCPAVR